MSRTEYRKYNALNDLLRWAYHIPNRYERQRAVANIQAKMAELMGEN